LIERIEALQGALSVQPASIRDASSGMTLRDAVGSLTQQLVDRQNAVREQISALGGSI